MSSSNQLQVSSLSSSSSSFSSSASSAYPTLSSSSSASLVKTDTVAKLLKKIELFEKEGNEKRDATPIKLVLQSEQLSAFPEQQLRAALSIAGNEGEYAKMVKLALVEYYFKNDRAEEAASLLPPIGSTPAVAELPLWDRLEKQLRLEKSYYHHIKAHQLSENHETYRRWKTCVEEIFALSEKLKEVDAEKYILFEKELSEITYKISQDLSLSFYDQSLSPEAPANVVKQKEFLLKAAQAGHAIAQFEYAIRLDGCSEEAIKWLYCSANQGNKKAQNKLLEFGKWLSQKGQNEIATRCFKFVASLDDGEAQWLLGEHIWNNGNAIEAISWVKKAAQNNYPKAVEDWSCNQVFYGLIIKAREENDVEAQFWLGERYYKGNWQYAKKYYEMAAKQNHAEAMWRLGDFLRPKNAVHIKPELLVLQDPIAGIEWIRKAAAAGHKEAQADLQKNQEKYRKMERAAKLAKEDPEEMYSVAIETYSPIVRTPEEILADANKWEKVLKLYEGAAAKGHEEAMRALAKLFERKDPVKAFKWNKIRAEKGISEGMYALFSHYWQGQGVAQNIFAATSWLIKAKNTKGSYMGDESAKKEYGAKADLFFLIEHASKGDGHLCFQIAQWLDPEFPEETSPHIKKNAADAFFWYLKGGKFGHKPSQGRLVKCYNEGIGVAKSEARAKFWKDKVTDSGVVKKQEEEPEQF